MQDTEKSVYHLKVAREASQKRSWNTSRITGRKEETIFRECNVLLYKALLMHAQRKDYKEPDIAVEACTEALARATDCKLLLQKHKITMLNYYLYFFPIVISVAFIVMQIQSQNPECINLDLLYIHISIMLYIH